MSAPRLPRNISPAAKYLSRHFRTLNRVTVSVSSSQISHIHTTRHSSQQATMTSTAADNPPADSIAKTEEAKQAPKLSDHDFKIYNQLAVRMDYFVSPFLFWVTQEPIKRNFTNKTQHENFRRTWNLLWTYATTGKRQNGLTLKQLVRAGLDFGDHLTAHHGIEERLMFPVLAKRMPEFDPRRGDLVQQHKKIHKGLDGLQAYLRSVQQGDEALEAGALKQKMESWGTVLWEHLDAEVKTLGGDNMAKYWSKEDMMTMRW